MRNCALALVLLLVACQASRRTPPGAAQGPAPQAAAQGSGRLGGGALARGFATGCDGLGNANALIVVADTIFFPYPAYVENVVRQIAVRLPPQSANAPLAAKVIFLIRGDGSLSELRLDKSSGNAAFDSATVRAIAAAGSADVFGRLPDRFAQDSLWLTLERRQAGGGAGSTVRYFLEQPPRITKSIPLPANPPYQAAHTGGRVRVRFVVDTTGWADVHTFHVVEASSEELAGVMQHVVGRTRFTPAEVGGCKVRREMQMGFEFQPQQGS